MDRDAQFHYINDTAVAFMKDGQPVISVNAKKELVDEYSNAGKEFQPKGTPARTKVHDFIDPEMGKAIPYGVRGCRRVQRLQDQGMEGRARQARQGDRPRDHGLSLPTRHLEVEQIEPRLFSFITMNWRGRPLTSYRVIVQLIANTTTRKGLNPRSAFLEPVFPAPTGRSGVGAGRDVE